MSIAERGQRLDRFKTIVAIILALLLLLMCFLLASRVPTTPAATATPVAQAPTTAPATQAPIAAPTVNADVKDDGTLTLRGTGTPGSTLQIVIDGQSAGEVTVGPDGKWTFNANLPAGEYKIEVNALDAGGKVTAAAPAVTVTVPAALAAPIIEAPTETIAGPVNFTISGTPNSDFQVLVDGKVVSAGKFGADGKATITTELAAGPHTIEVNALDAGGKVVASAEPLSLTLNEKAAGPTISGYGGDTAGPIVFNGTGTPGAKVQIVVDGQPAGEAEIGPDGLWSFTTDLTAGPHKVEVNELDVDGKVTATTEPVDLTLGENTAAKAPTLDLPNGALYTGQQTLTGTGTPGSKVQIVIGGTPVGEASVGADGKWSFDAEFPSVGEVPVVVNQLDAAGTVTASSETATLKFSALTLDTLAASYAPGTVTLGGSGVPGSKVQITVDGQPVGEAEVGADGKWSFPYNFTQAGNFAVAVNGLDASGQVVATTQPATARIKAPVAADIKRICDFSDPTVFGEDKGKFWLVDRCDTMTYIARRTNIPLGTLIAANPQVKNPDLIYPGWEIALPGR
ncbi:MAG: LysM peptidoglycan-binding domain-containing protein [Anaerolineales bacterium]|nr:LysM peptidoglycan-binding domain-containing protein [Anaerolineales bacterium]